MKPFYHLRVLGSPNPGQSFRRGLWGREATAASALDAGDERPLILESYSCLALRDRLCLGPRIRRAGVSNEK